MEVIRFAIFLVNDLLSILHVCGGDPARVLDGFTPFVVFSTYVEVIPKSIKAGAKIFSILHVCGGDPILHVDDAVKQAYSPRMWR